MEKHGKTGIIFGKFYPIHRGHINFIKTVSNFVDLLYLVVCTDSERDLRLFKESQMTKMLTNEERIEIVAENLKEKDNIRIVQLVEDGTTPYPNGWFSWTKKVEELLKKNQIKIDVIFTNEIQDIDAYYENFKKYIDPKYISRNFKVEAIDIGRKQINISATEIRNNPEKNLEYIPENVKEYFK